MPLGPESIADAELVGDICPLCLAHYAPAEACTCVVCAGTSCPGCVELLDSGRKRCYACAPVPGREVSGVRPIAMSRARAEFLRARLALRGVFGAAYSALRALYSSGLRSLKKPIEARSARI